MTGQEFSMNSDREANNLVSAIVVLLSIVMMIFYILFRMDVIELYKHVETYQALTLCSAVGAFAVVLNLVYKGEARWLRYVLMSAVMVTCTALVTILDNNYLPYFLPIILCSLYYNRKLALATSLVCGILILVGPCLTYLVGIVNLNYVTLVSYTPTYNTIVGYGADSITEEFFSNAVPSALVFILGSLLSVWLAEIGRNHMEQSRDAAIREAMVEKDVTIASEIQSGMLPSDITDREEFSIASRMYPAKTVGGDFYDFFMVDESHLAIVMADVSGKGISAAMFMATARTLIRSNVQAGGDLAKAMEKANREQASDNVMKYFVTVWIGVLDLKTGDVTYIDAGHNPPFIEKDGKFTKLEAKPDFVFGRKRAIRYNKQHVKMDIGDRIFLYTDGVTEAVGPNGTMYGEDRLNSSLDSHGGANVEDLVDQVKSDLSQFVRDAVQSDDITIMAMEYKQVYSVQEDEGITVSADSEGHSKIISRLQRILTEAGCKPKVINEMQVAVSEIFANLDMYAYGEMPEKGDIKVAMDVFSDRISITITDWGVPFNPLEHLDPDPVENFNNRKRGGLGIMIVKKICDDVTYTREGDHNILKLVKEI